MYYKKKRIKNKRGKKWKPPIIPERGILGVGSKIDDIDYHTQ